MKRRGEFVENTQLEHSYRVVDNIRSRPISSKNLFTSCYEATRRGSSGGLQFGSEVLPARFYVRYFLTYRRLVVTMYMVTDVYPAFDPPNLVERFTRLYRHVLWNR